MKFHVSFDLEMTDDQFHEWAHDYGVRMDRAASDISHRVSAEVREALQEAYLVHEYTSVKHFTVK